MLNYEIRNLDWEDSSRDVIYFSPDMKGLHWSSKVRTEEAKNQIEKNRSKLKETYRTTKKIHDLKINLNTNMTSILIKFRGYKLGSYFTLIN